jgi:hypothetical protein
VRWKSVEAWPSIGEAKVRCVDVLVAADKVSGVPIGPTVQPDRPMNPTDAPPIATVDARPPTSLLLYYSGTNVDVFAGPWPVATSDEDYGTTLTVRVTVDESRPFGQADPRDAFGRFLH